MSRRYRYYEILEANKKTTPQGIKRAFRRLALQYHPDRNSDPEAHDMMAKINQAYEVLSDPALRTAYDNSPEECPHCWSLEVVQTVGDTWRCRRCYCKFDSSGVIEVVNGTDRDILSERRREYVRLFSTTLCSWCRRFYTQPFLCPREQLQSSCVPFEKLTDRDRGALLKEERWWWRMQDMIMGVDEKGILSRCRKCLALNPNPHLRRCWSCGGLFLECPDPRCRVPLKYNIEGGYWKCMNNAHGKIYRHWSSRGLPEEPILLPDPLPIPEPIPPPIPVPPPTPIPEAPPIPTASAPQPAVGKSPKWKQWLLVAIIIALSAMLLLAYAGVPPFAVAK